MPFGQQISEISLEKFATVNSQTRAWVKGHLEFFSQEIHPNSRFRSSLKCIKYISLITKYVQRPNAPSIQSQPNMYDDIRRPNISICSVEHICI